MSAWRVLAAAAVAALPLGAAAQEAPDVPWYERNDRGVKAQAQVGVQFYPGAAGDFLGTGLAYGVLVEIAPFPLVRFELAYQGANYATVAVAEAPEELSVFENGAHLALKLAPRFGRFSPYALAGGGFSYVDVVEGPGGVQVVEDDFLLRVPLGLGVDFHFAPPAETPTTTHLLIGARATWTFVFDNDFVPVTARGADQLAFTALVGAQF